MSSRKGRKAERRAQELARQETEREEQRRKRRVRLSIIGGSMLATFAVVLGATLVAGGGGSSTSQSAGGASSSVGAASSVGEAGGSTRIEVGERFPEFRLTEASGESLTVRSLGAKPAIVWFTTSYCVPCQVGARDVAQLDDELGGKAFNVLVVFVDPSEPSRELTRWRDAFANDDWMVAPDEENALARDVGLQFLDSKFLLDAEGVIRNIDLELVDDEYVELVRQAAT